MWPRSAEFRDDVRVEEVHRQSGEAANRAAAPPAAWRNIQLSSCVVAQEQFLQREPRRELESLPILCRHQNGSIGAPFGDDLRTFPQAGFKHFTEPRLCILNRPS